MKPQPSAFTPPRAPSGGGGRGAPAAPLGVTPIAGATGFQLHLGAVPEELTNLLRGFGSKAGWQAEALMDKHIDKKDAKQLEQKNMADSILGTAGGLPNPGADAAAIRTFNQGSVMQLQPGTNKAKLHQFMDDLRQALHKPDDQMPRFWRYEAKTLHDVALLKQAVAGIENKFDSSWKGFLPNYAFDIEQAYQCIQHNCKSQGAPAGNLTLLELMSTPGVRVYFLQLVRVFIFDADVAASKRAPAIDDKLKMQQQRIDMLNWFLQYRP